MGLGLGLCCCQMEELDLAFQSPALWPRLRESFPEIQDQELTAFQFVSEQPTETLVYRLAASRSPFGGTPSSQRFIRKIGDNGIQFAGSLFSFGFPTGGEMEGELDFFMPLEILSQAGYFIEFDSDLISGTGTERISFRPNFNSRNEVQINSFGFRESLGGAIRPHNGGALRVEVRMDGQARLLIGGEEIFTWDRGLRIRSPNVVGMNHHTDLFRFTFRGQVRVSDDNVATVTNIRSGVIELNESSQEIPIAWSASRNLSVNQSQVNYSNQGSFSGSLTSAVLETIPGAWYVVEVFLSGQDFNIRNVDLSLSDRSVSQSFSSFHEEIVFLGTHRPDLVPGNHRSHEAIKIAFQAQRTTHTIRLRFDSKDETATTFRLNTRARRVRCRLTYEIVINRVPSIVTIGVGGIGFGVIDIGAAENGTVIETASIRAQVDDEGYLEILELHRAGANNAGLIDRSEAFAGQPDGSQGSFVGFGDSTSTITVANQRGSRVAVPLLVRVTEESAKAVVVKVLEFESTVTIQDGQGFMVFRPEVFPLAPNPNVALRLTDLGNGEYDFTLEIPTRLESSTNHAGSQGNYTFDLFGVSGELEISEFRTCAAV